jgi:hypothetical protein
MKVEILKEFKHGKEVYFPEEIVITEDTICKFWCDAGWAKDVSGIYPTGNPSPTETILLIENLVQPNTTLEL